MSKDVGEQVRKWAAERGAAVAWGSPGIPDLVRSEIDGRKTAGEFDPRFYGQALESTFKYQPQEIDPVRSILMIALPRPAHILRFETETGILETVVPVTYAHYRQVFIDVKGEVEAVIGGEHHAELVRAPLKSTAARTGLVSYGRNNITYCGEFGSYHQLIGLYMDVAPEGVTLQCRAPETMPECRNCRICQNMCPTGAIGSDRFLLHTERCLTFLNESADPWPDWLSDAAHNSIVGCTRCQERCPKNTGRLKFETLPEVFTLDETQAILAGGVREGPAWDSVQAKMRSSGLGLEEVVSRNLEALVRRV